MNQLVYKASLLSPVIGSRLLASQVLGSTTTSFASATSLGGLL